MSNNKSAAIPWLPLLTGLFLVASVVGSIWIIAFDGHTFVQSLLVGINNRVADTGGSTLWLGAYALLCVLSQLLVIPSGSLILIAAGFIFSPLLAAGIFSVAQVLCSWPVYRIGKTISDKFPHRFQLLSDKFNFPSDWDRLVQEEGFIATIVLRLTPVIPSAAACLLAAGLNISLGRFIPATIAVCWIRPLFFASVGGSLQALSAISDATAAKSVLLPLLLLFVAAVLVLLSKLYLRMRSKA